MLEYDLVYEDHPPRQITELELYLWSAHGLWKDPWTDGVCEQLGRGTWYVKLGAIKRSRIDITAGHADPQCVIWAGMLVRALRDQNGPALTLRSLVRPATDSWDEWTDMEAYRLCKINRSSIHEGPLQLQQLPKGARRSGNVYYGSRVLKVDKKTDEERLEYSKYKLRAATEKKDDFEEWKGN